MMSSQVSPGKCNAKYQDMSNEDLALAMQKMRFNFSKWTEIGEEIGYSSVWCRKIFEDSGLDDVSVVGAQIKTAVRNARILAIVNDNHKNGVRVSDLGVADQMKAEGFLGITRSVVSSVLYRARKAGVECPPANDVPKKWRSAQSRSNSDFSPFGFVPQGLEVQPIPPRTPELLAKGKVTFEQLTSNGCRYTPNEDGPFLFCGEAVSPGKSWCQDCYDRIIKRPPEEAAKARRNHARLYQCRNEHQV
jgi:hypothetical protein